MLDYVVFRSSIELCIDRFENLAARIFPQKRGYRYFAKIRQIVDWIKWWFNDSKYDSGILEDVVQEVFGTQKRLFDAHEQVTSVQKIGIMATTTAESHLRIFTNYNGIGRYQQNPGKLELS